MQEKGISNRKWPIWEDNTRIDGSDQKEAFGPLELRLTVLLLKQKRRSKVAAHAQRRPDS